MWIRSQDKAVLRNVNNIEIMKFEGEKYTTILGDGCHLGVYSTKEKAMEVLNDIYLESNMLKLMKYLFMKCQKKRK